MSSFVLFYVKIKVEDEQHVYRWLDWKPTYPMLSTKSLLQTSPTRGVAIVVQATSLFVMWAFVLTFGACNDTFGYGVAHQTSVWRWRGHMSPNYVRFCLNSL